MHTFLIAYGADNDMATFEADSPAHAVEQFVSWAPVGPADEENRAAINSIAVCIAVGPAEEGTAYAYADDGAYFGLADLDITWVPDRYSQTAEDVEGYLFGKGFD